MAIHSDCTSGARFHLCEIKHRRQRGTLFRGEMKEAIGWFQVVGKLVAPRVSCADYSMTGVQFDVDLPSVRRQRRTG